MKLIIILRKIKALVLYIWRLRNEHLRNEEHLALRNL